MVSTVINPAGVARRGEFARTDEYLYCVYFGAGGPYQGYIDRPTRGMLDNTATEAEVTGIDDDQLPAISTLPAIAVCYDGAVQAEKSAAARAVTHVNDEADRYASPDTYSGEGGSVAQPPYDPAKPHQICFSGICTTRPSIAAVTFPSVIRAIAMHRLTSFFAESHPNWYWLHNFGFFELSIATGLVIWVSGGYIKMYWPELFIKNQPRTDTQS